MKPRIFIGSSVEGLTAAYSIQQNLTYDAEVTVWDQGVFELSSTTIESLMEILEKVDFGVFVFSDDDVTKIRNVEKNTVRDNVLFEFGLFVGKLGRKRVFFVTPMNADLHIPTDLLGITAGKYDTQREDESLQAATGPVSHQIRQIIKKLGRVAGGSETAEPSEDKSEIIDNDEDWYQDFDAKSYPAAIKKLKAKIRKEEDESQKLELKYWQAYCEFKMNEKTGVAALQKLKEDNKKKLLAYTAIGRIYFWEDYLDEAIEVLEEGLKAFKKNEHILKIYAETISKRDGVDAGIQFIQEKQMNDSVELNLELSNFIEDKEDKEAARKIVHALYEKHPNDKKVKFRYAKLAIDLKENEIALFLLNSLTNQYPEEYEYWGYLSNCCVNLKLYDLALSANRKAEEYSKGEEAWIIANTGNMLKNQGFYTESISYLQKALEIDDKSEYAHNRLATALKKQAEESKTVDEKVREGRKKIRNYSPDDEEES